MFIRIKIINKKILPINTWIPWNPVAIKNTDPKIPSEKEKFDILYSNNWQDRNKNPNIIVIKSLVLELIKLFLSNL